MSKSELIRVLHLTKDMLQRPRNVFTFSGWEGVDDANAYMDECIQQVRIDQTNSSRLKQLYASLGPVHQVAMMSGWLQEYFTISSRFDEAMYRL